MTPFEYIETIKVVLQRPMIYMDVVDPIRSTVDMIVGSMEHLCAEYKPDGTPTDGYMSDTIRIDYSMSGCSTGRMMVAKWVAERCGLTFVSMKQGKRALSDVLTVEGVNFRVEVFSILVEYVLSRFRLFYKYRANKAWNAGQRGNVKDWSGEMNAKEFLSDMNQEK